MMSLEAVTCRMGVGVGIASGYAGPLVRRQQPQQLVQVLSSLSVSPKLNTIFQRGHWRVAVAAESSASSMSRPQQDVDLKSEVGVSYEMLRDKLAAGEWEEADAETRRLLCVLAGDAAVKRKWVYYSEVQFVPEADLKTIDGLWRAYSDNKFGYSVQRRIWKNCNESWTVFFSKVGWTKPMADSRNSVYKKFPLEFMWDVADPTPRGHLPLTNALRGTQLLEKLLSHPAFEFADDEEKFLLPDTDSVFSQSTQQQLQIPQGQRGVYTESDMSIDYGF
ncbi:unnamed protein product [Calypogeia fissa]